MFFHARPPLSAPRRAVPTSVSRAILASALLASAGSATATSYSVANLDDSGAGSLREAVTKANSHRGTDSITFHVDGTITLTSILPPIADSAGLIIDGRGKDVTISGNNAVQVMAVNARAKLELKNLTIANGRVMLGGTDLLGGGIGNRGSLKISNSILSGNSGYVSGGIYNEGTLTINASKLSENSGGYGAGGIDNYGTLIIHDSNVSSNYGWTTGAISNNKGTLNASNSTFSGNSGHFNGGIANSGTAIVSNSTFTRNSTGYGSGTISNGGTLTLINSTVAGNFGAPPDGPDAPGGISNGGTLTIGNTILSNNTYDDCRNSGTLKSFGVNWVSDGTCGFAASGDPLLGPLADNGGSTQTLALLPGSGAIDAGDDRTCRAAPVNGVDQRGIRRPQGWHCDIGAFEKSANDFVGFNAPVGNPPELNEMKAGQVVPLTFQVTGNQRMASFQSPYPVSKQIDCSTDQIVDNTPDPSYGNLLATRTQYTYLWRTNPAWAGTCRQFQILFSDGRFGQVDFSFQ